MIFNAEYNFFMRRWRTEPFFASLIRSVSSAADALYTLGLGERCDNTPVKQALRAYAETHHPDVQRRSNDADEMRSGIEAAKLLLALQPHERVRSAAPAASSDFRASSTASTSASSAPRPFWEKPSPRRFHDADDID